MFWNAGQPLPELAEAFAAVYHRVMPDLPVTPWARPASDAYAVLCAKATDGIGAVGAFGAREQWQFDWQQPYRRDEWLDHFPTHGGHAKLPAGTAGAGAGGPRGRYRRGGGQLHDALHHCGGHCGANLRRLTRAQPG